MDLLHRLEERRERLRAEMYKRNLNSLLVYHAANRYYLSGFELHDPQCNESAGFLVIMANGDDWLFTDARYFDAAKRLWNNNNIYIYKNDTKIKELSLLLNKILPNEGNIGYEANTLSVNFFEILVEYLDAITPIPADGTVEALRVIKDCSEIELIKKSCQLNHQLMSWVPSILLAGESETSIAWKIEKFFRGNGASELSFPAIVACGHNAALPHAIPSQHVQLEKEQVVLVDAGARIYDYCSDQTRTLWFGDNPTENFLRTLEFVQEAQYRGIKAIRPGVMAKDVYAAAYKFFETQGVEKAFTHNLGHGVGLEVHEAPNLGPKSTTVLKPGMVITVEPGLYYPDWGGVRWEHMVLVTEDSSIVL